MNFLKNSQTNWKYIFITVILAVLVGGGILWYDWWVEKQEVPLIEFPEIKKPEKVAEEKCENLQDLTKQAECYTDLAKETKDESYCEKISRDVEKFYCYIETAIIKDDLSVCEKWIEQIYARNACYLHLAKALKDTFPCERIEDVIIVGVPGHQPCAKENCYWNVAMAKKDLSICEKINPPFYRSACYLQLAHELKDRSICEKVENVIEGIDSESSCYHVSKTYKEPISWKTYQNEEYDYGVKYPENFLIERTKDSKTIKLSSLEDILYLHRIPSAPDSWTPIRDGYITMPSGYFLAIKIAETEPNQTLENWLKEKLELEEFKIGDTLGFHIEEILIGEDLLGYEVGALYGHDYEPDYYVKHGAIIVEISPSLTTSPKDPIFNQILSTLRFLE